MLDYLILFLASWRIAHFIADPAEDGPFRVGPWLRHKLGIRFDERSVMVGTNELAAMILCVWCSSLWVGAALTGAYLLWRDSLYLMLPFAISAFAILLESTIGGKHGQG